MSTYKKVFYVATTGLQYINTGVMPTDKTEIIIDVSIYNNISTGTSSAAGNTIFYSGTSSNNLWRLQYNDYNYGVRYGVYERRPGNWCNTSAFDIYMNRIRIRSDKNKIYTTTYPYNNPEVLCMSFSEEIEETSYSPCPLILGASLNGPQLNTIQKPAAMCIYSCQIFDDGNIIRDYEPVVEINSENEILSVGLHDKITDEYICSNNVHDLAYQEYTFVIGNDGYPCVDKTEKATGKSLNSPYPNMMWYKNNSNDIVYKNIENISSSKKSLTRPYPRSMWRCTKYIENDYPYHDNLPDIYEADPPLKYDFIRMYDSVRVISYPHHLNRLFPVTKMSIPLDAPEEAVYSLNYTNRNTLTNNLSKTNMNTWNAIKSQPTLTTMLASAQENASSLIKNASSGYVTFIRNQANEIVEIVISDEPDYLLATNIWRWNSGGLGHSSNGYNGTYHAAMTMDGSIVADMITAGTMYADRIHGGYLTMGGVDNLNGIIQVKNAAGEVVCNFDKDGGRIKGDFYCINTESHDFMWIHDGHIEGGHEENGIKETFFKLDLASDYQVSVQPPKGTGVTTPILALQIKKLLISDNMGDLYDTYTGTQQIVSDISYDSQGRVTSVTKKTMEFKNGILVQIY